MHFFTFEPGNGGSYRVLFGRAVSDLPLFPYYIVFGFAEQGDALITVYFDTVQVSHKAFLQRWQTATHVNALDDAAYLADAAWTLLASFLDMEASAPSDWRTNWRALIPQAVWS